MGFVLLWISVVVFLTSLVTLVVMVIKKKMKWPFIIGLTMAPFIFFTGLLLIGFSEIDKEQSANINPVREKAPIEAVEPKDDEAAQTVSGEYIAPEGWVKNDAHSTDTKTFYIKEGDKQNPPSNISVEEGKNRYGIEQHLDFRQGILRSISAQITGPEGDTTVDGGGSYTKNGDVLYIFTIEEKSKNMTTKQYYIVGDHKYILVISTDFNDPKVTDIDQVSQSIVDSFKWSDK